MAYWADVSDDEEFQNTECTSGVSGGDRSARPGPECGVVPTEACHVNLELLPSIGLHILGGIVQGYNFSICCALPAMGCWRVILLGVLLAGASVREAQVGRQGLASRAKQSFMEF